MATQTWELWYPNAASQGLLLARGMLDEADIVLVHAAPHALRVEVRDERGALVAFGDQLEATDDRPMLRLYRRGASIRREDLWPTGEDVGRPVILPGGEVGILQSWWNADDGSEWRWQVEFYNHR